MRTSRGDPQRGNEREREREREWYGARGTQPQPTQLAFQSSPLKPGSHATLKYQRQPAFQAAVERVDRIPSVSGTTILLHFPRDSAFLSLHPLRIFMADQPAPPDMRGGGEVVAKSRHRFPVKIYCDLVRIYSPRLYSILKKRRGDMRVYFRDR